MRNGLLAAIVVAISCASLGAQSTPADRSKADLGCPEAAPAINFRSCDDACYRRSWARGEYLLWWVNGAQLPVPLVTTGDPSVGFPLENTAGAIGQPSTTVLFGGADARFGAFSGMRFTLGAWLDDEGLFGIEGTGFLLERRSNQFSAASDAAGNPPLYIPAFNVVTQAERAVAISDPLRQFSGDVFVTSSLRLWGAELNGVFAMWRQPGVEVSLLAGFRYADLQENLNLNNTTNDLLFINTTVLNDNFATRNQFYGGQLGVRAYWQVERLSLDVTGKVALGSTHQVVDIQGNITQFGPGAFAPGTFPGGIFTQPSNIGRRTSNDFSVLPAVEARVGYQLTAALRAFVGYDFLYWSQVVRPGNQIDRNINASQSPIFGGGALVGPAAPTPLFSRSDFWAHGVSFGLEVKY